MAKMKIHKNNINKRNKHSASNFMPAIYPNPTLNNDNVDKLPKIILDCSVNLSNADINRIKNRLNFADHRDLRKLYSIRVVDPDTIKTRSKESTTGCYYPWNRYKQAEIWISSELIKRKKNIENFINRITYKDRLFETLFHELGHHKSTMTHSVDKFEGEAYAEKYMLAYKKYWKKYHGPSKLYINISKTLARCLRYILLILLYPFRKASDEFNLFYRTIKGESNLDEFNNELKKLTDNNEDESESKKRKWIHPLKREKYRNRFQIPDR